MCTLHKHTLFYGQTNSESTLNVQTLPQLSKYCLALNERCEQHKLSDFICLSHKVAMLSHLLPRFLHLDCPFVQIEDVLHH